MKMNKNTSRSRVRTAVFVTSFLLFLLIMDYPYLSRIYNDIISGNVIASYQKTEEASECGRRILLAQEYNRYLAGDGACPDESWRRWEDGANILCMDPAEKGLAGWIRISSLDLYLPLYIGTQDDALRSGAGILEGSSLPVGGTGTHTCISAHRGLPDRTLFTNLDLLKNDDIIEIHTLGKELFYKVFGNETVLPSETGPLAIIPGKDLLTLITCTPYGINTHRLYVHAERCADPSDTEGEGAGISVWKRLTGFVFWKRWWWIPATAALLALMCVIVLKKR